MALVRALNSAIAGLQAQQFRTDTIGDNLANVDTTGFKATRVDFQTLLSQLSAFGTAPQGFLGGTDPLQLGLGVQVKSTTKNFSQGALKATGIASDIGIEGEGFFIMLDENGEPIYSRDGAFTLNPSNLLHNPRTGFIVQGYMADLTTFTITTGGTPINIEVPIGDLRIARETDNAYFDGNLNSNGPIGSSGTVIESDRFLELAGPAGSRSPTGNNAGLNTLLIDIGRQTVGSGFLDLQLSDGTIDANGDGSIDNASIIEISATKGGRSLPATKFMVASTSTTPPPAGIDDAGATVGDFLDFLEDILGINNGVSVLSDETYSGLIGTASATAIAGTPVSSVSFTDPDADSSGNGDLAEQLELEDYIRFTSGDGAGQIGQITAIGWAAGTTTITFTPLDVTRAMPAVGDNFELNERARVSIGRESPAGGDPFPGVLASVDTAREDMQSIAGTIRISGNAGTANGFTKLEATVGGQRLAFFNEILSAIGESALSNASFFDSLGTEIPVEITYVLQSKSNNDVRYRWFAESVSNDGPTRTVGTGVLVFDTDGQFLSQTPLSPISIDLANTGADTPLIVNTDYSKLTAFANDHSEVALVNQDGYAQGILRDFATGADGIINGIFTNGQVRPIAQLALSRFANNNGLESVGNNMFRIGTNSGLPIVGTPGTFGRGFVRAGFLEESNVDIAKQFTDLIVSQRAFQANSRTIRVADDMLQDLINII